MSEDIYIPLDVDHVLHIHGDKAHIHKRGIEEVRLDKPALQILVDNLIEMGLALSPEDKLKLLIERCMGSIVSARFHITDEEERGIYVVPRAFPVPATNMARMQELAEEVFDDETIVWVEKEPRTKGI